MLFKKFRGACYFNFGKNLKFKISIIAEPCDNQTGWVKFNDKCYKLLIEVDILTRDIAFDKCLHSSSDLPSLVFIQTSDEQEFLANYIFNTLRIMDGVWIGAKRVLNESLFKWDDGASIEFNNWAESFQTENEERLCVKIVSSLSKTQQNGDWKDTSCLGWNFILCQKLPSWAASDIRQEILELKAEMAEIRQESQELKAEIQNAQNHVTDLVQNPGENWKLMFGLICLNFFLFKRILCPGFVVPIGFIYGQLPNQPEPNATWSQVQWQAVTQEYAGLFFRAEGNNAAKFGVTQDSSTLQITRIEFQRFDWDDRLPGSVDLPPTGWSSWMRSGFDDTGNGGFYWYQSHRYHYSSSEVRPRNTAVRLWKRSS